MGVATSLTALIPVFFVLVLGYLAGRYHEFDDDQTAGLNRLVLTFALPASLLATTAQFGRAQLLSELPVLAVLLIALTGGYVAAYLATRRVAGRSRPVSALAALNMTNPAAPFYGTAVLGALFGASGGGTVAASALVINVAQTPIALALLQSGGDGGGSTGLGRILLDTIKKPLVWAPLLGVAVALIGLPLPPATVRSLELIGQATSGVALFAAGLILSRYRPKLTGAVLGIGALKVLVLPALVLGLVLLFGLRGDPARGAVVACALPVGTVVSQLALGNKTFVEQSASVLLLTTAAQLVVLPLAVVLTNTLIP